MPLLVALLWLSQSLQDRSTHFRRNGLHPAADPWWWERGKLKSQVVTIHPHCGFGPVLGCWSGHLSLWHWNMTEISWESHGQLVEVARNIPRCGSFEFPAICQWIIYHLIISTFFLPDLFSWLVNQPPCKVPPRNKAVWWGLINRWFPLIRPN